MDRLLRLGGGMPGLNQGPPPSDAPVVDTAEQVFVSSSHPFFTLFMTSYLFFIFTGVYIVLGSLKNAQAWSGWSTDGGDGFDAG